MEAAAVQDHGHGGREQHRRVTEILQIASGGERSKLGVALQIRASWWLSVLKNTNGDQQDLGFGWVLKTLGTRALPDPGHIQLRIQI
jgi:hypothetical protein